MAGDPQREYLGARGAAHHPATHCKHSVLCADAERAVPALPAAARGVGFHSCRQCDCCTHWHSIVVPAWPLIERHVPPTRGCLQSCTASLQQEEHRGIIRPVLHLYCTCTAPVLQEEHRAIINSIDEGLTDLYHYESVPLPAPMHRAAGQEAVHIR